jgi:hypothetical protein
MAPRAHPHTEVAVGADFPPVAETSLILLLSGHIRVNSGRGAAGNVKVNYS